MAQFDVYKNPSSKTKDLYPYILDIQQPLLLEVLATRIVIPLGHPKHFKGEFMEYLTPEINFNNEKFLLLVPQIASMPTNLLKEPVGTLEHYRNEIISALDFATSGI